MNRRPSAKLALILLAASVLVVVVAAGLLAWLDDDQRWAEVLAAAGIVATVVATAVLLGTRQGWANGRTVSLAALSVGVVGMGAAAMALMVYVGVSDDTTSGTAVTADPNESGSALASQKSNNDVQPPGFAHDLGNHPTYQAFMEMDEAQVLANVPGGTVLPGEVTVLQGQLAQARTFAEEHDTVDKAMAAGYYNTTNDVPFMGAHFLNRQYLTDGKFDPSKPEGLLFSKKGAGEDAEWQLVGVWYLLFPGLNPGISDTKPPEGFAGGLDLWHAHKGLCTRAGTISENNSAQSCATDKGNFIGDLRWMMHVWVWPEGAENPDGVFTYLNTNLYEMQQAQVSAEP